MKVAEIMERRKSQGGDYSVDVMSHVAVNAKRITQEKVRRAQESLSMERQRLQEARHIKVPQPYLSKAVGILKDPNP